MRAIGFIHLLAITSVVTSSRVYDVVIIGAGPAAIGAAIDLKNALPKISMTLLEARNRVGGRVLTDTHTFSNGVPADVGAEWIHAYGPKNPLYNLHRQLQTDRDKEGDETFDLFEPTVTGCYDTTGATVSQAQCNKAKSTMKTLFSPRYNKTLKHKDVSVADMVRAEYDKIPSGQLKQLIDAMLIGKEEYEAADLDLISARQAFFRDSPGDDEEEKGEDMALQRGFGTLIQRIADRFALPIELNTRVTRVATSSSKNVQITTDKHHTIQSKFVLVTVPLGCLKHKSIAFEPALPHWKQDAIDSMGFGDTDKIIMQFDRVFWNSQLTSFYIAGSPFPFAICASGKRILVFMIGGSRARRMEDAKDEDTIATILKHLRSAFPDETVRLQHYRISRWSQDVYARGSYSYFALNTSLATFDTLGKECCHGQLFWAGEHTSSGGSVHTAFATGQREAKKILLRLK